MDPLKTIMARVLPSEFQWGPDDVPFVQFLRPDGRPRPVAITRDERTARHARMLRGAGWRFEIEELHDGTVSMTVEGETGITAETTVLAHELVPNGPDVPATVDRLVETAYAKWRLIQERGMSPLDTTNGTH